MNDPITYYRTEDYPADIDQRPQHNLKTHPEYFHAMRRMEKTFEMRLNDRNFQVGDILRCAEYCPVLELFHPSDMTLLVTYIMHGPKFGLAKGWCVMGFKIVEMNIMPQRFMIFDLKAALAGHPMQIRQGGNAVQFRKRKSTRHKPQFAYEFKIQIGDKPENRKFLCDKNGKVNPPESQGLDLMMVNASYEKQVKKFRDVIKKFSIQSV